MWCARKSRQNRRVNRKLTQPGGGRMAGIGPIGRIGLMGIALHSSAATSLPPRCVSSAATEALHTGGSHDVACPSITTRHLRSCAGISTAPPECVPTVRPYAPQSTIDISTATDATSVLLREFQLIPKFSVPALVWLTPLIFY